MELRFYILHFLQKKKKNFERKKSENCTVFKGGISDNSFSIQFSNGTKMVKSQKH